MLLTRNKPKQDTLKHRTENSMLSQYSHTPPGPKALRTEPTEKPELLQPYKDCQ